ncbi:MobQ family relaxase [Bacillus atrophaeus]|uniref:MobQ family relaxase n=3 Tax=Bacillus atrophaeus TaxID=1452 RepID=UPI002282CAB0|nr:MobQ family relaxase [Bacillus atrophaeus]MCY8497749.1 MobA/MobL family protein [Bacillus atrophaeus]MCY8821552.1 MobA/MobL family protein [Bacillus atrophaeus]MCY8830982.1 MobA/MobL family protein [Bacillus atrophaeus]MCY8835241.1 MobA/MobL family protein [Bacillus atrophaeus]MEC0800520.1 MobQ family relaxase [Bacillus atrophaeus]
MAIYHFSCGNISRGDGQSATAAAAYRSGESLYSERYGKTNNYERKVKPDSFILKPKNAPDWVMDRERLWNEVEKIEKAKNARLAKHFDIALPLELSNDQQRELVIEFCKENFSDEGMVADIAIHRDDENNPHFHVMTTTRPFNEDGTWSAKSKKEYILDKDGNFTYTKSGQKRSRKVEPVDWNSKDRLMMWRKSWADKANEFLSKNGHEIRISEKSNEELGIDKKPTIHEGYKARKMGDKSERTQYNKNVKKHNENLIKLSEYKKEIKQVKEIENITRNFSPKEKKQLSMLSKELKTFVNFDTVQRKEKQLAHWERSELFKSQFGLENKENLSKINNQKELITKAETLLKKEAQRFVDSHYKELIPKDKILSDFQKQYITDLSVRRNKILDKKELDEALFDSENKEFYSSISKMTRDTFNSYSTFNKSLERNEKILGKLVKEFGVDFNDPKTIEGLNSGDLNRLKTATIRVNNTKNAMKFIEGYYKEKITELYPEYAKEFNEKMPVHEKEIVIASYDYYGRVLQKDEIMNLKDNPPTKYSNEDKEYAISELMNYGKSHVNNNSWGVSVASSKLKGKFPEIFGRNAKPGMEQLFFSELSQVSDNYKKVVDNYLAILRSEYAEKFNENDLTKEDYYVMSNYRKTTNIGGLLTGGFSTVNKTLNEIDNAERDKINEMNRLQEKVARRNRRNSGLER